MTLPVDKGNKVAVQRALDAFCRARGTNFLDRPSAIMHLLEALEEDWTAIRSKALKDAPADGESLPDYGQLSRAARRLYQVNVGTARDAGVHIMLYRYPTAPLELQALSQHGGDEDWIAVVPESWKDRYHLAFLEGGIAGNWFGCSDVSQHTHPNYPNQLIFIGAHA
jgi:hypothetical protein